MKKKLSIAIIVFAMLLASFAPLTVQAEIPGWDKQSDGWHYYYDDSNYAYGGLVWFENDQAYYYFNDKGVMQTGWIKETNTSSEGISWTDWFYANSSGVLQTGWQKIGKTWYYFEEGYPYMYSGGRRTVNGKEYFFADSGAMLTGWIKDSGTTIDGYTWTNWYYANSSGALLKGWQNISGTWYYFDPNYYWMYSDGVREINGTQYFFNPSGAMGIGWCKRTYEYGDGYIETDWYYANGSGALLKGWQKISGTWYYFDPNGFYMLTGYRKINGKVYVFQSNGALWEKGGWLKVTYPSGYYDWYYTKADGTPYEGWQKIGGKWYYFYPDAGWMAYAETMYIDGKLYLFDESGALVSGGWKKIVSPYGDHTPFWYYANSDGTVKTGWYQEGSTWYYFRDGGVMTTCPMLIEGTLQMFASGGAWTGRSNKPQWVNDSYYGDWYYCIDNNGTPAAGWLEIGGKQYYFDPNYYYMYSWLREIDGTMYFFNGSGELGIGWCKRVYEYAPGYTDVTWYYTDEDGIAQTGWLNDGGKWYYLDPSGYYMYKNGSYMIDGNYYYFDTSGVCQNKAEVESSK